MPENDELPLEMRLDAEMMRIDVEIRDVLSLYRTTAWNVMEHLIAAIDLHKWCRSQEIGRDIGTGKAIEDWLVMMDNKTSVSSYNEMPAESDLRRILWHSGETAWSIMKERKKDLNDHLYYSSLQAGKDIGREAATNDWIKKYTWYRNNPEIMKIEYDYKNGEHDDDEKDLYEFVRNHRDEINAYMNRENSRMKKQNVLLGPLEATMHTFIRKYKSASPEHDIKSQTKIIRKKIEEKHADDDAKRMEVATDWAAHIAPYWRDHHIMVIDYILKIKAEQFIRIIKGEEDRSYARRADSA